MLLLLIWLLQFGCIPSIPQGGIPHRSFFITPEKSTKLTLPWLLDRLQLRKDDLGLQVVAQDLDSLSIPLFRELMAHPFLMQGHAMELYRRCCASKSNLHYSLLVASNELGIFTGGFQESLPTGSTEIPLMRLVHAADQALDKMDAALLHIPPLRRTELLEALEEYLLQQPSPPSEGPQKTRREKQRWMEQVLLDLAGFEREALIEAALVLAREVDTVIENGIMPLPPRISTALSSGDSVVDGDVLFFQHRLNGGHIIVGGKNANTYRLHRNDIVVDMGGDDRYTWEIEPGERMPAFPATSIIIDMEGDDIYFSPKEPAQGSGVLGIDILVDLAGNDQYLARHIAQGCGFIGVGILADWDGNDRYLMDTFGQGAGGFGVGLLLDSRGNDILQGRMMVQGIGFTGGAGLLMDGEGNDQYSAGQAYPDFREERRFTKSLSQGFGMGIRDYAPGGIGILLDGKGNDIYLADYFGQGAGYWLSIGLLIDASGNDRYMARRYVQGAGIHFSAGALVDMKGDDRYAAWGVAQGCGHDYALGMLWDENGNDLYAATWLSQGAGNSQGVGILVDVAGDDLYDAPGKTVQGSATYNDSRGAGSIGIFLDGQGNDHYRGRGRNDAWWRDGRYGGGGDFVGISPLIPHSWIDSTQLPPSLSAKTEMRQTPEYDEILPEFERDLSDMATRREAARTAAARSPSAIPVLLSYLDMRDVFTQIIITESLRAMDASVAADWIEQILRNNDRNRSPMLLYLLGEIGGPKALKTLRLYLKSPQKKERIMAIRGIWRMGAMPPIEEMAHLAEDESSTARRFLAHVLGRASDFQSLRILKSLLSDRNYNVRFAAKEALEHRTGSELPPQPDGEN